MKNAFHLILIVIITISFSSGCRSFQELRSASAKSRKNSSGLLGLARRDNGSPREIDQDEALDPLGARDGNRLLLDDLSVDQIATTFRARTSSADPEAAQSYYDEGQKIYQQGIQQLDANPESETHQAVFVEAANQFRLAAAKAPDSDIEMNALFYEGESYFFADRYVQSNRAYEKLLANYSGTRYLDQAENRRFAIAVYWLKLSDNASPISIADAKRPKGNPAAEARRILHRIRIDDPTGKLADDATLALGQAFMAAGRHYEAADTFEDLRRNYPGSKHLFTAHMLELQARMAGYQGKSYDDTPLRKADLLLKTIVRQFPEQSREQIEYLEEQAAKIGGQIAERDYALGQYFEGRGENRAAKFYYEKVAQKYETSELGQTIQQQITEVANRPPKPKQHAQWLVDLFPNPEKERPAIIAGNNERISPDILRR